MVRGVEPGSMEDPLYEEDIAASNPGRTEQAREMERYLATVRDDEARRKAVFDPDFTSETTYHASTERLRQVLRDSLGYPPPGAPDQEPPQFTRVGEDGLATYYRTRFSVLPGVHVIGLYLVPKAVTKPAPLVVSMHGGAGSPELATFRGGANYHDMVRGAAQQGYVVWAPTHLFKADGFPDDIRQRLDSRARLVGATITAIEIAKITRGLDVVLTRPEVDARRVAMVGLSYGGFYTLYTMALEPRIRVGVSSCIFGNLTEGWATKDDFWKSDWRFPNGLSLLRDPEIIALICPRPLEVQMGERDELVPIEPARRQAPQAASYYERLGVGDRFRFHAFSGKHEFYGPSAWEFLAQRL